MQFSGPEWQILIFRKYLLVELSYSGSSWIVNLGVLCVLLLETAFEKPKPLFLFFLVVTAVLPHMLLLTRASAVTATCKLHIRPGLNCSPYSCSEVSSSSFPGYYIGINFELIILAQGALRFCFLVSIFGFSIYFLAFIFHLSLTTVENEKTK